MRTATDATADAVLPDVEPTDTTTTPATDDAARDTEDSPSETHDTPDTDESWVAKCQRQFSGSDRRLGNLVDGENAVVDVASETD